jgi:hypothetical protein
MKEGRQTGGTMARDQEEVIMKQSKILFVVSMMVLLISSVAAASDFSWIRDFNIQAEADPSGFRARLATRFQIGDMQINAVLGNVEKPADAYMVLRLGEMSGHSPQYVLDKYKSEKRKGWGALARSLGIKPGSREFHALKRRQDLNREDNDRGGGKGRGKGHGKKW